MPNRLAAETSPYLLQHAENPVDWYPWGNEAFEAACRRDVPMLLSIGYAACHWCHVMEKESFEDETTAALMNERFVCVKVDREQRPDIDAIYMEAVQTLTGHGGWPLTVFCAGDGTPFLGGTYFPPEDRHGMPSFTRVLSAVDELWRTRRPELLSQGTDLMARIRESIPRPSGQPLTESLLDTAAARIAAAHDPVWGGFGRAPKFPQAPVLEFCLRAQARGAEGVREALETTLRKMAAGGIYDQLGGGFHRYSTDERWLVPHFEKMLYDQAQMARVYTHAWQAFKDPLYARIACETLEYVLRDLRHGGGGLYSSQDADSQGVEGRFYVWSYEEVARLAPDALEGYTVTPGGNWEGSNILTLDGPEHPEGRAALLAARERRVRPSTDDKVLASWNGLAIAALAEAGAAFGRTDFVDAAARAADFVSRELGGHHSWRDGRAQVTGLLEDRAYLAEGLWELWQATFQRRWLDECVRCVDDAIGRFWDEAEGGFWSTSHDAQALIVRTKEVLESATPSPQAVLALLVMRLGVLLDRDDYRECARRTLALAGLYMERAPQACGTWLQALDQHLCPAVEVAFAGDASGLRAPVDRSYLPRRVLAGGDNTDLALLARRKPVNGRPAAYVCENYVCRLPVTTAAELDALLHV